MRLILFSGPSMPANVAHELLPGVDVRPPAACGDIYRASLEGPTALGLIDGYFDHRLSVWHKEILWALHRGIHVYGAASMGALRAAELAPCGMVGVGWVYEQFRSGRLEDDDEVALVHEAATEDYRPRSEAMVNLRMTLRCAVDAGSLTATAQEQLTYELKRIHYPQRSRSALRALTATVLSPLEADRFDTWLTQNGIVDQKQQDARALLDRLRADREGGILAKPASGRPFHPTNAWQALVDNITGAAKRPEPPAALLRRALERALAVALAQARGMAIDGAAVQQASEEFRRERGLLGPSETASWLSAAGLDLGGFSSMIHDGVLERALTTEVRRAIAKQLADVLRIEGPQVRPVATLPGDGSSAHQTASTK